MVLACLALLPLAFLLALPLTASVRAASNRLRAHDTDALAGQVKAQRRRVPNTGGIAIFLAFVVPILAVLLIANAMSAADLHQLLTRAGLDSTLGNALTHIEGIRDQTSLALLLLASLTLLHLLGLIDDRRPRGPWLKLAIMAIPALAVPILTSTRLLTALDVHVGGPWLSIIITALWFLVVTNAMNFMDNMDGLAGSVAVVAAACLLAAGLMQGQWFVSACLALLIGALLGFLVFNFPLRRPATIFMGDGGSLVVGFILAFLTARTTYYDPSLSAPSGPMTYWYAVFMPLIILAVPLYDFTSVVLIRLSQGRSPFVGDLQHLSHRIARRGLSVRATVITICGFTAITGANGIFLRHIPPTAAVFAGIQTLLVLGVIALIEYAASPRTKDATATPPPR